MLSDYQIIDLDTQQKVRYVSESSNASTSGYSNVSQQEFISDQSSPTHGLLSTSSSMVSMPSPSQSPSSILTTNFAAMGIPHQSIQSSQQQHQAIQEFSSFNLQNSSPFLCNNQTTFSTPNNMYQHQHQISGKQQQQQPLHNITINTPAIKSEYTSQLVILEEPAEKFRFRYKSEMHGTHGSLNGVHSKKTPKTFPEVELKNFNGHGVIRCSLYQTDLECPSPHSHQLVVRKDDQDICDPHDLYVSPEKGYIAQFQNMGIIHTAKKFIFEELYKKKIDRLKFQLGVENLSLRQQQEVRKETEKETKSMNLNQVRLCFEAFKIDDNEWIRIAEPVFSHPINNRKSAQTGELRICRLSSIVGSVTGGDDLILLVEKVSKKNIQVRFYEMNDDEEITWEALGKFRESDVHHQYAIVVQTPPYKNKDIDRHVHVFIELVRPSDDERSFPVTFRYKPRDALLTRKRRRTCSTTNSSSSSTSLSSSELPEPVAKTNCNLVNEAASQLQQHLKQQTQHPIHMQQQQQQQKQQQQPHQQMDYQTLSEEYNKEQHLRSFYNSEEFMKMVEKNSSELKDICAYDIEYDLDLFENGSQLESGLTTASCGGRSIAIPVGGGGQLEVDGAASISIASETILKDAHKDERKQIMMQVILAQAGKNHPTLQKIFKVFDNSFFSKNPKEFNASAKEIQEHFTEFSNASENGDSLVHDVIISGNVKMAIKLYKIIEYFHLNEMLSTAVNFDGESPLHYACLHNKAEYIRPLLGLGCDPNLQDNQGNTPLHIAIRENHKACIDGFVKMIQLNEAKSQFDVNLVNDDGLTPLHMAIRSNNLELTRQILRYNSVSANVANSKDGNNALHLAVLQQSPLMVRAIFELGKLDEECPNRSGHTPIELAKSIDLKVRKEILDILLTVKVKPPMTVIHATIKEEPLDDTESSTEEDDDMSSLHSQSFPADVKKEEPYSDDGSGSSADNEQKFSVCNDNGGKKYVLKEVLQNPAIFSRLVKILAGNRWKILASHLKMDHLLCLWSCAEPMLAYIRNNDGIQFETFYQALSKVDAAAAKIVMEEN